MNKMLVGPHEALTPTMTLVLAFAVGCGGASPTISTTPPVSDEHVASEVVDEEVDEDAEAALALLSLLDDAEIPPLEGDLKVWRDWDGMRWGVAVIEEGQEEWSNTVKVGLGARSYVSSGMADDTTLSELADDLADLPAALETQVANGRGLDANSVIMEGRIHSVMALAMARRALREDRRDLALRFARVALDVTHQSSPYGATPLHELRGDLGYALMHFALS